MIAFIDSAEVARRLPLAALIDELVSAFLAPAHTPLRQRLDSTRNREMLVMPAMGDTFAGAKLLTVVPRGHAERHCTIQGVFVLFDFNDGRPLCFLDASELTSRRTAAVSAIAARQLARPDAESLLLVGAGHLIPFLAEAHMQVRCYSKVKVWARDGEKGRLAAARIAAQAGIVAEFAPELESAARQADVISCATRATDPLIEGSWLKPGTHLDLVGGYRPDMRESDDVAISSARIFVDTIPGSLAEAGDLLDPISRGIIAAQDILGDLADLARGASRQTADETTVFKAVGTAAADLAAAALAWKTAA